MAKRNESETLKEIVNLLEPLDKQISKVKQERVIYGESIPIPNYQELEWEDILGSGVIKKKVLKKGSGGRIHSGAQCIVNIKGYLANDTLVEDYQQLEIVAGDDEVVKGLDIAISLMEVGEKALIEVDYRFAYGERGIEEPIQVPPKSTIMYKVEVVSSKEELPIEELTLLERIRLGSKKRERGNWWFQRDDHSTAIHCYRRALEFLDIPEQSIKDSNPEPNLMKQFMEDRQKVLTNLATAQFNLKAYDAALLAVDGVLQFEPTNVKALYRKGQILSGKKLHTEAMSVFKEALQLEPNNMSIRQELNRVQGLHIKDDREVRKLYKKMLGREQIDRKINNKASNNKSGRSMAAIVVTSVAAAALAFVAFRYSTQFHD